MGSNPTGTATGLFLELADSVPRTRPKTNGLRDFGGHSLFPGLFSLWGRAVSPRKYSGLSPKREFATLILWLTVFQRYGLPGLALVCYVRQTLAARFARVPRVLRRRGNRGVA